MKLKAWAYTENKDIVVLIYEDNTMVCVKHEDFDRAFGPIISATKEEVMRDFMISA